MSEKKTYEELEQEARQLRSEIQEIQSLTSIGNWEWDIGQKSLRWSDEVYRIFGFEPASFKPTAEAFEATIHPDDLKSFLNQRETMLSEKKKACIDHRIVLPDGSIRYVQEQTQLILDNQNNVRRVIGTVQDITERKQAEEAIKNSESKYHALFDNSLEAIFLAAQDGRIFAANQAACHMLGMSEAEIMSGGREAVMNLNDPHLQTALEERRKNGKFTGELTYKRKDGTIFPVDLSSVIFMDQYGKEMACIFARDITERKRIEKEFYDIQQSLQEVLENSLDASYKRNFQTDRYDYLSPVFKKISGHGTEEIKTLPIEKLRDLIHPDDLAGIDRVLAESMSGASGKAYQLEYRFKNNQGGYIWLQDRFSVKRDTTGKSLARIGSVRDITGYKQVELALLESEEKYRNIFSAESDAIFLIDKETGSILEVNKAACEIYGYTQDELIRLKNTDVSAEPEKTEQATKNPKKSIPLRYHKKKDGAIFPVDISASSFILKGRQVILAAIRDVTDREIAKKLLQQNEERLRLSLAGADLGMWDWDVISGFVTFNDRWAEMLGYTMDEIEPNVHTWEMLVHPEDNLRVSETLNAHLEGKTDTYSSEHRLRHKSGKWIWILDSGRVIERDVNGKALRICGTHLDITERKTSDEELAHYRNHLEELVELRTIELKQENTKRRLAERSLQKANEDLKKKASLLEDMNTALNVLLNKREQDVQEIEEKIFSNYESIILPFFDKLKNSYSNKNQITLIEILEKNLKGIVSPFSKKLSDPMINLTPKEIQLVSLIKQGITTKEMAQTLNCSIRTIDAHRDNIRFKLKIKNKKINLRSFLMKL